MWGGLPKLHFSAGGIIFVFCIVIYHSGVGLALFLHVQRVSVCWTCPGWHAYRTSDNVRCTVHRALQVCWTRLELCALISANNRCAVHRALRVCWTSLELRACLTSNNDGCTVHRALQVCWTCLELWLVWLVIATGVPCTGLCRCVGHKLWNYAPGIMWFFD